MTVHSDGSLYGTRYDFPIRDFDPSITYMIAAIPRTGSTYLSTLLWRSGALGAPLEYLNIGFNKSLMGETERSSIEYWREIMRRRTSINGVFGWKMFIKTYQDLSSLYPALLPELTPDVVIYLDRRDKVAHAVSYYKAISTQAWFSDSPSSQSVSYDFQAIHDAHTLAENQRRSWEEIFELTGTKPIRIFYEDFCISPDVVVADVCQLILGDKNSVAQTVSIPLPGIQRDAESDSWSHSYRKDLVRLLGSATT